MKINYYNFYLKSFLKILLFEMYLFNLEKNFKLIIILPSLINITIIIFVVLMILNKFLNITNA
jgi:hypothetical protein